ncbi:MBL fold metallo-hydrolase [Aerococcaceae bacterium zg-BR22]|uniref:YtnP family quorum-quenching lactonase n=1 Tax=Aerococcaceae bacterium zg-1292 TaxID=2774330 RepID=UPI00406496FA|nr:MBL fold metallo-hydrolase [Aerococcaceae bacterium zg-BR22]
MDKFSFGDVTLTWLDGGVTAMDGGAMFGVVPRPLWTKKYRVNENNQIELPTDPILIQYQGENLMIDSSLGNGKLSDKQKRNFGVFSEPKLEESLNELGLTTDDIDILLMTHMHFDHAGGLTIPDDNGQLVSRFKNARIITTQIEWDEMRHPNRRSKSTYFKENWQAIVNQVETFEQEIEILPGITMIHTGGHSNGHAIIKITQGEQQLIHMGDIMPTKAHQNPLWVLAYDDYPMDSIAAKIKVEEEAYRKNTYFSFYHDVDYRIVQWDENGKDIVFTVKRTIAPHF